MNNNNNNHNNNIMNERENKAKHRKWCRGIKITRIIFILASYDQRKFVIMIIIVMMGAVVLIY